MKRLTRAELAERVGPQPPSDAFWNRVIAAERGTISVGPEVVGDTDRRERRTGVGGGESGDDGPSPGDMIDVARSRSSSSRSRKRSRAVGDTGSTAWKSEQTRSKGVMRSQDAPTRADSVE